MKILHIVPSFGIGGMEKVICSIINNTSTYYDHEILVLYDDTEAKSWIKNNKVNIKCLDRSRDQFHFLRTLYSSIKEIKPNLLMNYTWGATDAIWLGRLAGIRRIIHNEHGFNVDEARATSLKRDVARFFLYRMASSIIVVSRELKNIMETKFFIKENKIIFIANGIDTDIYSPDPFERIAMRETFGFTEDNVVIGFSGRLDPIKNFDFMLNIFEQCVKRDEQFLMLTEFVVNVSDRP